MRTIDEYMILPYKMEITPDIDEGGFVVLYSDLPGCLTVGDIIEEGIHREREGKVMQPVYVDIHIHTSENPNIPNENYNTDRLVEKIKEMAQDKPILVSLTDHNMINKVAYLDIVSKIEHVILGAELHIKKYEEAPPYHCHILFNCEINEENIDRINSILNELYPDKMVTDEMSNIPNIERISNSFDDYEYLLMPHGGQSHRTFDKATAKGHRFDTSMEKSIYYNHFDGFTARSNSGLEETISYFEKLGIEQFTNLITCSDNYNPETYPGAKSKEAEEFIPTWIFSEPTYDGLKLSLSEKSRIYYSKFPPEDWGQFIYGVSLKQENCEIDVNMTPGLNVVIGGSSSGKTLFVDSIVRKLKNTYSDSQYIEFGIDNLEVINPSSVVPHYINQNFIINVLQNGDLNLGDIELIKEVFPEDTLVTQKIRQSLEQLRRLIEKLVDSAQRYEQCSEQLIHLVNPSHLIISKVLPKTIASLFTPNAEEKGRYRVTLSEYEEYVSALENLEKIFEKSQLSLPYKEEIATLKKGLSYIFDLSELSEAVLLNINALLEKEIADIAEDDRENSQKIEQRKKLIEATKGALAALKEFDAAKNELAKFNVTVSSKELIVSGHKLRIENQFELTKVALVDALNKCLKNDKRILSFESLKPETIFKTSFSERPKVKDYSDFVERIYGEINGKNKRFYKIITSDGRDFDVLSPGWKSAVILDLILGYDGDVAPLIIDQPEDNLATDYINSGLVNAIKRIKPQKQIILVSHNATIPMLGDAQNVIVCSNEAGKIRIQSATLESEIEGKRVLDYIAEITDGGKPSIRKRVKKYDLKKFKET